MKPVEGREISVASTTDSQEAVNEAAGIKPTTETTTTAAAAAGEAGQQGEEGHSAVTGNVTETRTASDAVTTDEEEEHTTEGEGQRQEGASATGKDDSKKLKKRVDKLTRQKYALADENTELKEKLRQLEQRTTSTATGEDGGRAAQATAASGAAPRNLDELGPKPKSDDKDSDGKLKYADVDDFVDALTDWKAKKAAIEARAASETQTVQQRAKTVLEAYDRQVVTAREEYEDFDEALSQPDVLIPEVAQAAIIEMDNGADVAYYLATHPEERDRLLEINKTSTVKVVAALGVISKDLADKKGKTAAAGTSAAGGSADANRSKPAAKAGEGEAQQSGAQNTSRPQRPQSRAPEPIRPVGGSQTRSSVALDELPYSEYRKVRDEQTGGRRR